jgi:DNA mismatch endonuclease (patch repair protein)
VRAPEVVSYTMSRIRGKNTGIELALRRSLWRAGLRYRLHRKGLPGTPDIIFSTAKVAVFCDSSFWHGRDWATKKSKLKTNRNFWIAKIERNMARDVRVSQQLRSMGWIVLRFWDLQIEKDLATCVRAVTEAIRSRTELRPSRVRFPRHKRPSWP